jgi:hypothetical protein
VPKQAPRPADFLVEALPTTKHAAALFDRVVDRLAGRAVVLTKGGGRCRVVFLRAGSEGLFVLPWPLLQLFLSDPPPEGELPQDEDQVFDRDAIEHEPEPWRESVDFAALARPAPSNLTLYDGPLSLRVNYRSSGGSRDGAGPAEDAAFEGLISALSGASDDRIEHLAEYVGGLDIGRHGPARVILPRVTPGGFEGAWLVGRAAIRGAMAERRVPPGSFWAVADGHVGTAIVFGKSRDEALTAWRTEVERLHPAPPPPVDRSSIPLPDGPETIALTHHTYDAPAFDPSPEAVPAAVVRVAALPTTKLARGAWTRLLGDRGVTQFAVRLPIDRGRTIVGESLLPLVDLATIDETLDALDEAYAASVAPAATPTSSDSSPPAHLTVYYRVIHAATGLPIEPRIENWDFGPSSDPRGFDVHRLRTHILRTRVLE